MKRVLASISFLLVVVFLLAGERAAGQELAPGANPQQAPVSTAFTYQGQLKQNGSLVNGNCDLRFSLWDDPSAGAQIGSIQTVANQTISDGLFTVQLNGNNEFTSDAFSGEARWLKIEVRCPAGSGSYTPLSPRQPVTAVPYALGLRLPLSASGSYAGAVLSIFNTTTGAFGDGLFAQTESSSDTGVTGYASASSGANTGVKGQSNSNSGTGVYGVTISSSGNTYGVWGESLSSSGTGVRAGATNGGVAVWALSNGSGITRPTLHVENTNASGISIFAEQNSNDAVLVVTNEGAGDLIRAFGTAGGANLRFRVTQNGDVYADEGFHCGNDVNDGNGSGDLSETEIDPCLQDNAPADFAEMLPATAGLAPGDVLVIGPDGRLALSSEAYQTSVVGVYSTRPSYLGNSRFADEDGYAPLAIAGVVPVKVSAENGPIQPGDMLATAGTPGHAMRCEGVELCFGRTIGKALAGWEGGTGVILVLVILQ
ncbi:MAG: hypothetical protein L0332_05430 [Chloroflexi bacterium]|nr:hypothetical protein [Chloroflexota bacterium]MCI0579916.1 hypothetical protein [Chloroflexota bacterium]MCI0646499.1 hypothetical protein [Chloroflexota bacterium]MCI0726149.1 hypothetical protein [Chloroflexota bacterium]